MHDLSEVWDGLPLQLPYNQRISVCGHSLGVRCTFSLHVFVPRASPHVTLRVVQAYLVSVCVLAEHANIEHLMLASPVGVITPPSAERQRASYVWRVLGWLWDCDCTPQGALRFMGPFGPRMAASIMLHRFASMRFDVRVFMRVVLGWWRCCPVSPFPPRLPSRRCQ